MTDSHKATGPLHAELAPATWHGLRLGPLLMVLAGLSFTLMFAFVKVARVELSVVEIVFWRSMVTIPLVAMIARRRSWTLHRPGLFAVRATFGFLAMLGFFYAAKGLSLTDHTLIGKLQPVLMAALAPLVLGRSEGGGLFGWVLIGVGLLGTSVLLAPELQIGSVWGMAAVAAAFASATAHLAVRRLTRTDQPAAIVLWFQVSVCAASLLVLLATLGTVPIPPVALWAHLLAIGIFTTGGQVLMTYAYSYDKAPIVAAAGYTSPLWAVGLDVVAWGVVPGWNAWLGGALVVAAGLGLVLRRSGA